MAVTVDRLRLGLTPEIRRRYDEPHPWRKEERVVAGACAVELDRASDAVQAPGAPDPHRFRSFASWKDFVHDNFPWLELHNHCGARFEAEVTLSRLGGSLFSVIRAGACEATRKRHLAEASEAGHIKLLCQISGHLEIEQDGRSCRLEAGEVGVCDTARAYGLRLPEGANFAILMLPYDALPGWEAVSHKVCGRRVTDSPATRAAFAALMSLTGLPTAVVDMEGLTVITAVKWMLSVSLLGGSGARESARPENVLMAKARRHIVEHISDPDLGPDHVASALCMSRRSLYLLFKEHCLTPSKMIHDIRLEQAMRALGDPAEAHRKMTSIAFDAGFTDYATFSRLFKAQYGVTPSDFRSQQRLELCA